MLSYAELDNNILKKQLTKKFPHKVNLGIFDDGKIKGVDKFPVYDATKGFTSHAKPEMDPILFSKEPTTKYNVSKPSHTPVGKIQPNYFNENQSSLRPKRNKFAMKSGEMSHFFGIPCGRDIVLENPTAQAMNMMGGKMTEEKMKIHNWQKEQPLEIEVDVEAGLGTFMNDTRMQDIINSTSPKKGITSTGPVTLPKPQLNKGIVKSGPLKTVHVEPAFHEGFKLPTSPVVAKFLKKGDYLSFEEIYGRGDETPAPPPAPGTVPGTSPQKKKQLFKTPSKDELTSPEEAEGESTSPKEGKGSSVEKYEFDITERLDMLNKDRLGKDPALQNEIRELLKTLKIKAPHGNIKNNDSFYDLAVLALKMATPKNVKIRLKVRERQSVK